MKPLTVTVIILQLGLNGGSPCCPFHVLKESSHFLLKESRFFESSHTLVCMVLLEHAFGGFVQMLDTFLLV